MEMSKDTQAWVTGVFLACDQGRRENKDGGMSEERSLQWREEVLIHLFSADCRTGETPSIPSSPSHPLGKMGSSGSVAGYGKHVPHRRQKELGLVSSIKGKLRKYSGNLLGD